MLKLKKIMVFSTVTVMANALNFGPAIADTFQGVAPPPELGEKLTEYRTRQQRLEQAVQNTQGENFNPEIKIYRKKADGTPDYEHPEIKTAQNSNDQASIRQLTSSQVVSGRAIKTVDYPYTGTKNVKLRRGEKYIITVKDGDNVAWPIYEAEMSNAQFKVTLTDDHQVVVEALANAPENGLARLKVLLGDNGQRKVDFLFQIKEGAATLDYKAGVRIAYTSPLNTTGDGSGTTNMTVSAKARNSRRVVTPRAVESEIQSTTKSEALAGSIRTIEAQNSSRGDSPSNNGTSAKAQAPMVLGTPDLTVTVDHGLGYNFLKAMGIIVLERRSKDPVALAQTQEAVLEAALRVHQNEQEVALKNESAKP